MNAYNDFRHFASVKFPELTEEEQNVFAFEVLYNIYSILKNKKTVKLYFVRLFLIKMCYIVCIIGNEYKADVCCHWTS